MTASLRALLTKIIDYAGMFPPAQLPMDEAIRNYARYRTEPESWMLGRFICPAARLNELSNYVDELFRDGPPLAISALGRGGNDEAIFLEGLKKDLEDIESFQKRHDGRVTIDVYETRLPADAGHLNPIVIPKAATLIHETRNVVRQYYYEQHILAAIIDIANYDPKAGHKLRCGGTNAEAVPSSWLVASVIIGGGIRKVPLKFTAGLHHPFRHMDHAIKSKTFGFLNVFGSGVLANANRLNTDMIEGILEDEDPSHFQFDNDGMSWRDLRATIPQIESARRNNVISFGSCSFDEPREDLKALGWL